MTLEKLNEQKAKYQKRAEYFKALDFVNLAADFQGVVELIEKMEEYVKEKENGQDTAD